MERQSVKKILVPTDFSDLSVNAIKTAAKICARQKASMTLVHIVEHIFISLPDATISMDNYFPELKKSARQKLRKTIADIIGQYHIEGDILVEVGDVAETICSLVLKKKADLVVMGTHGASGLRELFIGSNAYRVVKYCPCPVMTVPPEKEWLAFRNILFPVRIVPDALKKYEFIRPIIQKNKSALTILGLTTEDKTNLFAYLAKLVSKLHEKLREDDVSSETMYFIGPDFPKKVLLTAREGNADLIVITADLDAISRKYFIGPYAQQIVNHAKVPVLSIRSEAPPDDFDYTIGEDADYFYLLSGN